MPTIKQSVYFKKPVRKVFDYITTTKHWPKWYPATLNVWGVTNRPAKKGEEIFELVQTAGLKGFIVWTVTQCQTPLRWTMRAKMISLPLMGEAEAEISYRFKAKKGGTQFQRTFTYQLPKKLLWFDLFFFRRHMKGESQAALNYLQKILDSDKA
jgi:uncharacterized protein YndB with AHSA1/START domain